MPYEMLLIINIICGRFVSTRMTGVELVFKEEINIPLFRNVGEFIEPLCGQVP